MTMVLLLIILLFAKWALTRVVPRSFRPFLGEEAFFCWQRSIRKGKKPAKVQEFLAEITDCATKPAKVQEFQSVTVGSKE
ncbi:hypothetical protein D3C76_170480 [compost metagenome]